MAESTDMQPQKPRPRYPKPSSAVGRFFWRKKMWIEATFALSMLERWEKLMVCKSHSGGRTASCFLIYFFSLTLIIPRDLIPICYSVVPGRSNYLFPPTPQVPY